MSGERMPQQNSSFVVRIWRGERGEPAERYWRGWVQHVRSGEQCSFQDMAELISFIQYQSDIEIDDAGAPHGLS